MCKVESMRHRLSSLHVVAVIGTAIVLSACLSAQAPAPSIRNFLRINDQFCTGGQPRPEHFAELKATFNSADYVGNGKVVFDVGGNKYRIVGLVGFKTGRIFILFVGTHAEYDAVDVEAL